jgi:hypothetical protein
MICIWDVNPKLIVETGGCNCGLFWNSLCNLLIYKLLKEAQQ